MKSKGFLLITFFIAVLALPACKKDDPTLLQNYQKSYAAWLAFKEDSGNSYRYTVTGTSWTGMTRKTTITVQNGKVTERAFTLSIPDDWESEIPEEEKSWTETGNEIGTRMDSGAAAAITFDELYTQARKVLRENPKATFEAKNSGLISLFGVGISDCVDDCFRGTYIESITVLTDE